MNEELVRAVARAACCPDEDRCPTDVVPCDSDHFLEYAKQLIEGITAAGYAVVPREPTEAMTRAGCDGVDSYFNGTKDAPFEGSVKAAYRAMLAAAERDDG